MKLLDVNVLVYAHRPDAIHNHAEYAAWLTALAGGPGEFALSESVLSSFVRVVTNPRVFRNPTPVEVAIEFCEELRRCPCAAILRPGPRNWLIFRDLCLRIPAAGKLAADAWHAALALEYDCEWISTDSDFARFPGLRWRHPLQPG